MNHNHCTSPAGELSMYSLMAFINESLPFVTWNLRSSSLIRSFSNLYSSPHSSFLSPLQA
jgi:hypothetical protein